MTRVHKHCERCCECELSTQKVVLWFVQTDEYALEGIHRRVCARGINGRVSPRTGVSERIVLAYCTGKRWGCVCFGEGCSCSFWESGSWVWETRFSDDVSHFLGGSRHGRCSRVMASGLEIRVLDDVNARSFAGSGCKSFVGVRCTGFVNGDLPMGSIPGYTLVMGNLMGKRFG